MLRSRLLLLWVALGCGFAVAFPLSAGAVTAVFTFTGGQQDFVVPAGVAEVTVSAFGARGGAGSGSGGGAGAGGGAVTATIPVTPGETLVVLVGGAGGDGALGGAGGFNGGGVGGIGLLTGGGGGGASDVRQGGSALADRVVVAAGGGGGGSGQGSFSGGAGGAGGGTTGMAGGDGLPTSESSWIGHGGGGGTQGAGGAGGTGGVYPDGSPGGLGEGGAGANAAIVNGSLGNRGGGGGGGGRYGGGGGEAAGEDINLPGELLGSGAGGGGSSFPVAAVHQQGVRFGDGLVVITFTGVAPTLTTSASPDVVVGGAVSDTATLTGGVGPTGTISFSLYGPGDADCSGAPVFTDTVAVAGNGDYASAGFTPSAAGVYRWTALYSGDIDHDPAVSACNAPGESVVVFEPGVPAPTSGVSVAGACDPLLSVCAGTPGQQEATPVLAPPSDGGGGPAVGRARMPNLRATVRASWEDGTVRVTVRVLISKPKLVRRSFLVRVRIPSLDQVRQVRVRAHGKRVRTLHLTFTAPASTIGSWVGVRVDPTRRVLETSEGDNTARTRIS